MIKHHLFSSSRCAQVKFTGSKWDTKLYRHHTQWIGGLKEIPAATMRERNPERILRLVRHTFSSRALCLSIRATFCSWSFPICTYSFFLGYFSRSHIHFSLLALAGRVGYAAQECVARRAHEAAENLRGRNAPARGTVPAAAHRRVADRSVRFVSMRMLIYIYILFAGSNASGFRRCLFPLLFRFSDGLVSISLLVVYFLRAEPSRSDSPRSPKSRFTFRRRLHERMSINHSAHCVPCRSLVYIAVVKEEELRRHMCSFFYY